jgi:hypothetical protein
MGKETIDQLNGPNETTLHMGQVTIYLDSETERRLNAILQGSKVSKSKWICDLIRDKIADSRPEGITKLAGAWKDFPLAEKIRNQMGGDAEQEPM